MDLGHLLQEAGCSYRIFDLGRHVAEVDRLAFARFEQGEQPWPLPLRQHAWFALLFQQAASDPSPDSSAANPAPASPFIWFLQLPLDSEGRQITVARDHFVRQLLSQLGGQSPVTASEQQQQQLAQSPFIRKPDTHRMAVLHSLLRARADNSDSRNEQVLQQLADDWQQVPLQAIADLLHSATPEQLARLNQQWLTLPAQVREELCGLLELRPLPSALQPALDHSLKEAERTGNRALLLACCRVLFASERSLPLLAQLLDSPLAEDLEFLSTVAARGWSLLAADHALCQRYLDCLDCHQEHNTLAPALRQELASLAPLQELRHRLLPEQYPEQSPQPGSQSSPQTD